MTAILNSIINMCENVGDFSNGNTYQGIDEGNVMAQRMIDAAKEVLKEATTHETP
jgi:hypothetical protein